MSAIHSSNSAFKDDTAHFIDIGELENNGLHPFREESLLKDHLTKIVQRPFDFIAIVPDIFEPHNDDNRIVINPLVETYASQFAFREALP